MRLDTLPTAIPNFITASSPMGLRRLMLLTNARLGARVTYFDIQYVEMNGRMQWIAWFYENMDDRTALKELGEAK
jgi:hypothetical protein